MERFEVGGSAGGPGTENGREPGLFRVAGCQNKRKLAAISGQTQFILECCRLLCALGPPDASCLPARCGCGVKGSFGIGAPVNFFFDMESRALSRILNPLNSASLQFIPLGDLATTSLG